jgi:hypothetical protein
MLGPDVIVSQLPRLLLGQDHRLAGAIGEALEQRPRISSDRRPGKRSGAAEQIEQQRNDPSALVLQLTVGDPDPSHG